MIWALLTVLVRGSWRDGVTWRHRMPACRVCGGLGRECGSIMTQHDFMETALPISAEQLGVTSLLAQAIWWRGLAKVSLAVGLAL